MTAIHLNMMRLEGNGERGTEEATAITPPHQHGIAKPIQASPNDRFGLK